MIQSVPQKEISGQRAPAPFVLSLLQIARWLSEPAAVWTISGLFKVKTEVFYDSFSISVFKA